ncbi:MAG: septum formation initiator family protein [Bacilli bacterium]|nr:septum formation initiator family protein [Bacilli bacterium]
MSKIRIRLTIYITSMALMVSVLFLTCFNSWVQINKNNETRKQLEEKYNKLVNKEDELSDEVNRMQDPEYVAKYAREKYLYTKDGELIIDVSSN